MRASVHEFPQPTAPSLHASITRAAVTLLATCFRRMRERSRMRRQLAVLFAVANERELNDMPVCWSHIEHEANKPFWQE